MAGTNPGNIGVRGVHINTLLANLSVGYHPDGMVAEQIAPVIPVNHESDFYAFWDKGQVARAERTDGRGSLRPDRAKAKEVNFGFILKQYLCEEYALKASVSDRERANADVVLNLEVSKTRRVRDLLLLDQEIRVASLFTTAGNYASANKVTLSGANQWNSASFASQTTGTQSVIEKNIDDGREAIRIATLGKEPNTIIVPRSVARVMKRDVGVRDQIKYTDPSVLVGGHLPPTLWGLNVVMPGAVNVTSVEGEAVTTADVWGKNVIIAYIDSNPGTDALTFASIFRKDPFQVRQFRDEETRVTYYEGMYTQDERLVSADCGYLISAAIA